MHLPTSLLLNLHFTVVSITSRIHKIRKEGLCLAIAPGCHKLHSKKSTGLISSQVLMYEEVTDCCVLYLERLNQTPIILWEIHSILYYSSLGTLHGLNHGSVSHQITLYYAMSSGYKLKVKVLPVPKLQSTGRTHQYPKCISSHQCVVNIDKDLCAETRWKPLHKGELLCIVQFFK